MFGDNSLPLLLLLLLSNGNNGGCNDGNSSGCDRNTLAMCLCLLCLCN